jgi:ABC-type polysaccharide/polyol phosphate transport system ATPase subunit
MSNGPEPSVEFRSVSLRYRISSELAVSSLKEWAIRRISGKSIRWDTVNALQDVSLHVYQGETLGIIGHNGAGKSTLLRIAGGILTPSDGLAITRGRIAPVIELGIGFEHELTGIENIYFNGALLGRSRREMSSHLDGIVRFADIGEFIEQPLRTYSTGMVARLAFAIATAVEAQVLLLDEVLSVGDEEFKHRCLERIEGFRHKGVTILFVSHDLEAVGRLCDRAIWLHHGRVRGIGRAKEIIDRYLASVGMPEGDDDLRSDEK